MTVLVVAQNYCHARLLASHLSQCLGWEAAATHQLPEASSRGASDAGIRGDWLLPAKPAAVPARLSQVPVPISAGILVVEYPVLGGAGLAPSRLQNLLSTFATLAIGVHARDDILPLICAGLRGCVGAESDEAAIAEAVRAIAARQRWFDRRAIEPRLAELAVSLGPRFLDIAGASGLTVREGCVLALLAQGATCAEVADVLCICNGAARNIVSTLYRKLGVHRKDAAVVQARKRGLIADESEVSSLFKTDDTLPAGTTRRMKETR
jgi:DNA-binding NarL/FixJ family response regulator